MPAHRSRRVAPRKYQVAPADSTASTTPNQPAATAPPIVGNTIQLTAVIVIAMPNTVQEV